MDGFGDVVEEKELQMSEKESCSGDAKNEIPEITHKMKQRNPGRGHQDLLRNDEGNDLTDLQRSVEAR